MDDRWAIEIVSDPGAGEEDLLEVFASLAVDGDLRETALNHPGVSNEAIRLLLVGSGDGRRGRILASTDRGDILSEWACALNPEDRGLVAFNPGTPTAWVRRLAQDSDPHVRANAVFNPRLPAHLVAEMAVRDQDPDVREAAETALGTGIGWSLRQGRRWVFDSDSE